MVDNPIISIFDKSTGSYYPFTGKAAPSDYSVVPQDGTKMERSVTWLLDGDFIATKDEIKLTFNLMPPETLAEFIRLTKLQFFDVQYYCIYTGEYKNGTFYRGNDLKITTPVQWDDPGFRGYKVQVSLIER